MSNTYFLRIKLVSCCISELYSNKQLILVLNINFIFMLQHLDTGIK